MVGGAGPNCLEGSALNQRSAGLSVDRDTATHSSTLGHYSHWTIGPLVEILVGEFVLPGRASPCDEVYSVLFAVFPRAPFVVPDVNTASAH
jgi:hypothetical protein